MDTNSFDNLVYHNQDNNLMDIEEHINLDSHNKAHYTKRKC